MTRIADKYRLGKRIGGGGMAEVVEAEIVGAEGFARKVAIKRILAPLSADPRFGEMFVNEARLASLLHHPNIVSVLDFDSDDDGVFYLVMERVRGVDLSRLASAGRLPFSVSAFVVAEVLRGLAYAHELVVDGQHLHIVHRDISPHNVMLSWSGGVKVVDFGIAKAVASSQASRSGSLKGKLAYMSPEQAHAGDIDGRSDVFAVGVMLHELLTGRRLFVGATEAEVLANVLTRPIPRPRQIDASIPETLDALTMAMLERELGQRIASASLALEELLASGAVSARGSLDLSDLLRVRFPADAPTRADLSGPARRSPSAMPVSPLASSGSEPVPVPVSDSPPVLEPVDPVAFETTAASDDGLAPPGRGPVSSTVTTRNLSGRAIAPSKGATARPRASRSVILGTAAAIVIGFAGMSLLRGASAPNDTRIARAPSSDGSVAAALVADSPARGTSTADASIAAHQRPSADAGREEEVPAASREEPSTVRASSKRRARETSKAETAKAETNPELLKPLLSKAPPSKSPSSKSPPSKSPPLKPAPKASAEHRTTRTGHLTITVEPWAVVTVDGKSYGQTPVTVELSPGRHRVVLVNDDFGKREEVSPRVRIGATTTVRRKWGTALQ